MRHGWKTLNCGHEVRAQREARTIGERNRKYTAIQIRVQVGGRGTVAAPGGGGTGYVLAGNGATGQ